MQLPLRTRKTCAMMLFSCACLTTLLITTLTTPHCPTTLFTTTNRQETEERTLNPLKSQEPAVNRTPSVSPDKVALRPARQVRVLVWVMTSPKSRDRAMTVNKTWGRRVAPNILLFMSSVRDPSLPSVALNVSEGRDHLTAKTMQAFDYVYKHYFHQADFFMKVDDDTYVVMENLRYFLSRLDPEKPFVTGRHFKPKVKQGFNSGGAGYVLSRAALQRLASRTRDPPQCREDGEMEDVELHRCLESLGVPILNSTDDKGGSRFHAYPPMFHVVSGLGKEYQYWDANVVRVGPESISEYPITFHYIRPKEMKLLHFFMYRIRPYGISYTKPTSSSDSVLDHLNLTTE